MEKEHKTDNHTNFDSSEKIELVHSGEDYFSCLHNIISNAQSEIHLQTYIFENDSTGARITNALKKAVMRNVKVYVLLDGYGSSSLSRKYIKHLKQHGINVRFFSPFFSQNSFYLGRRLHHKIVVADAKVSLIGGINISDRYSGTETQEPWLDYAVYIENKAVAEHLQQLCRKIFFKKIRYYSWGKIKSTFYWVGGASVRIIQNDWMKRKNEISTSYIKSIRNAKKEIIIVSSYFLPGRKLANALKKASASKGVKVKLILSGISDVPFMKRATYYLYSSLLKHNIELYEWKKSVLHGKVAVVDREWATVGSFNLNHLSSYGSIEMNAEINSREFSEKLATHLHHIISYSENITHDTLKNRKGIFTDFINWLAYRLIRIALIIVTYIPYKRIAGKS